jgi:redox-sensing transcriptional repressor
MDARRVGRPRFFAARAHIFTPRAGRGILSRRYSPGKGFLMKSEKISELTTSRLSVYLRCLNLLASAGIKTISSQALADQFRLNSAQIRKDLAHFGEFGTRGVGYSVDELRRHLTQILGLDSAHRVGIVGAGNLGTALANYNGFRESNFEVVALFDNDREKIGGRVGVAGTVVHDVRRLARVVRDEAIDVAVIAVPARVAQRVLNQVMSAGVKAVLNFAPVRLHARLGVKVKTVDLTISLESLSYFLARPQITCVTNPRSILPYEEIAQREEQELQN